MNACVTAGSTTGPIDVGVYDTCTSDPDECQSGPCSASGTQSEWLKVQFMDSCPAGGVIPLEVSVYSQPSAPFDLDVYESTTGDAGSKCPKLTASATAKVPDPGALAVAGLNLSKTGELYIHVVAEAAAKCTTGQRWSLTLYP